MTVGLWPH